ncbi:MAG TPA: multifunctional oxoglutarate decarboxylase/oxoglutarate dehydrogenase thiamine pyrophosphate-binding subunit/dihydrolipoyllysine-residue succinyltransferase subunit, partial [Acidimicrobiales bacterium]
ISKEVLKRIAEAHVNAPDGFTVHPKVLPQLQRRAAAITDGPIDWGTGEILAFASLLMEGRPVRLAGQDSRRGTFVQRFGTIIDRHNADEWTPLANLSEDQARFYIYDSLLSEYAALGFEYGYSVTNKDALVCWEAQFGDFVNGASTIIDQYLVAAEDKWGQSAGLVLLLPHGYEGQGAEHSSARIERFLMLAAEDNIQVCNATTAAQYFHLLRRQMHREVRKPLVLFTPKSLLRAKPARSKIDDLTHGSFEEVLDDPFVDDPEAVRRVVLCSGKVGVEALIEARKREAAVAVVRVEQLYPWPFERLDEVVARYPNAHELVWLQEEPTNMAGWWFAQDRLAERFADTHAISRVSRYESGSPATGSHAIHVQEQEAILDDALRVGTS